MGKEDTAALIAMGASGLALGASLALLLTFRGKGEGGHPVKQVHYHHGSSHGHGEDDEEDKKGKGNRVRHSLHHLAEEEFAFSRAGFSMAEARKAAEESHQEVIRRTPQQVLEDLQKGNTRFWTGLAHRPDVSAFERRALIAKQFPTTAVLGCADSRVPVEIVFDQGLGDLFVCRVAGNCLDSYTTASLQYAVHHLKVKVLMVMGHEGCGAIKAAQLPAQEIAREPQALAGLLRNLKAGLDTHALEMVKDVRAHDREAVTTNVKAQVEKLLSDDGIMKMVRNKELLIVGAFYEISSGIVDFFHEVSEVPDEATNPPSKGVMSRCNSRLPTAGSSRLPPMDMLK